jgi:hypothetical protein
MHRVIVFSTLTVVLLVGCTHEQSVAGRYAARSSDGHVAIFTLDTMNRYWVDGDSANGSYFESGDSVLLSVDERGLALVRRGDTLRYEDDEGKFLELVRIRAR